MTLHTVTIIILIVQVLTFLPIQNLYLSPNARQITCASTSFSSVAGSANRQHSPSCCMIRG